AARETECPANNLVAVRLYGYWANRNHPFRRHCTPGGSPIADTIRTRAGRHGHRVIVWRGGPVRSRLSTAPGTRTGVTPDRPSEDSRLVPVSGYLMPWLVIT